MSREPRTEWINLTPRIAKSLLSDQHPNRPLNKRFVAQLADQILHDKWRVTHQSIAVDWDGRMVDGQHRCQAVIESNKAIKIQMMTGVSREVALTAVDQGKLRGASALLAMRGVKNASTTSAILRCLAVLTSPTEGIGHARSPIDDARLLEVYGDRISEVLAMLGSKRIVAPVLAPFVLDFQTDFMHGLVTGANLSETSPILLLSRIVSHKTATTIGLRVESMLKTISALDAHRRNDKMQRLALSTDRYKRWCVSAKVPVNSTLLSFIDNNGSGARV